MPAEVELEKTYLMQSLPDGIEKFDSIKIHDIYVPETAGQAILRLRQKGDEYEITKKVSPKDDGFSSHIEYTIPLSKEEFEALAQCSNKDFVKRRYFVQLAGRDAEVDVYEGSLEGLIVVDFEFASEEEMNSFATPDFVLADVTPELAISGGYLAGKSFADILPRLAKYGLVDKTHRSE